MRPDGFGKRRSWQARRGYAAIEREGEALGRLGKIRAHDKVRRRKAKRELSSVRRECAEAIERFDEFEVAMDTLRGALECVDINTGELHRPEHVQALIEGVAQRIESLGVPAAQRDLPALLAQSRLWFATTANPPLDPKSTQFCAPFQASGHLP